MNPDNAQPSPRQSFLTANTLEQVLCVIYLVHQMYEERRSRVSIPDARQKSVHHTAELFNVSYQTINDACYRRLGMDSIKQFDELLYDWLVNRDHTKLIGTLKSFVQPMEQNIVEQVVIEDDFSVLKTAVTLRKQEIDAYKERMIKEINLKEEQSKLLEDNFKEYAEQLKYNSQVTSTNLTDSDVIIFQFQLDKKKGEQLRLLAGLQNLEVSEYVKGIVEKILAEEMLNVMKQQIQNMSSEKKKEFLSSL